MIYLFLDYLDSRREILFELYNQTKLNYWHEKLTFSKPVDKENDCVNLCLNVKREECDFLVFDKGSLNCHIGVLSWTSGNPPVIADEIITLLALKSNQHLSNNIKFLKKGRLVP